MALPERRNNVRFIGNQPFRDTPEPRIAPEQPEFRQPEWVRRARAGVGVPKVWWPR